MKNIDIDNNNSIQNAARVLKKGGILVFPTDTVYGIGCRLNEMTIRKLYKIKNRPLSQPTSILLTKSLYHQMLSRAKCDIDFPKNIQDDFFEGKITIVLRTAIFRLKFPKIIIKNNKIGIRLPQSAWLEKLINKAGPIVTTSANKKGARPPAKFADMDQDIIDRADLTVKTNKKLPGLPSRVYDLELKKYLR